MTFLQNVVRSFSEKLDKINPRRICNRVGHHWAGGMSPGPHRDHGGGQFYALRYRIICKRCHATLDDVPRSAWPDDNKPLEQW